jgi:Partial alpha/beta-hydrolase lipase region
MIHNPLYIALSIVKLSSMPPPAELVQPYGYPLEAHTVQTADGYLLGVFRMPQGVRSDAANTHRRVDDRPSVGFSVLPAPCHVLVA